MIQYFVIGGHIVATVRYLVNDVERSIAFYTKILGFKLDQSMAPAFARVSNNDLTLWLAGPRSSAARPMPDGRQPEPGGWNRFVLEIADLESRVAEMKQAGLSFRNDVVTGLVASRSYSRILTGTLSNCSKLRDRRSQSNHLGFINRTPPALNHPHGSANARTV
jgi:catechol 2,3-dioxygenase-like lactoylglutathione lyase family enzyme